MEGFVKVAKTHELPPGEMKMVELGDDQILLTNLDGQFYAISDVCTHAGGSLSDGSLEGEEVECPLHGSRFNARTGEVLGLPADEAQPRYEVRVVGTDILVKPSS